ncbi:NAD-dependent protein deacetylase sirtuin-1-like [Artemia franciscana]
MWKSTCLHEKMSEDKIPLDLLRGLIPDIEEKMPVEGFDEATLWRMLISLMNEPERRTRLQHISTMTNVLNLIRNANKILVLTGAGVSVSCGIPDFRSRDGVYARLSKDFPDLPDPTAMFDISYFRKDPRPFFKFAGELWPGEFKPSLCHRFIRQLEKKNKLLRNYTQNIDTMEQVAEIQRVVQCHGSFSTATCMRCQNTVKSSEIEEDVKKRLIPICRKCHPVIDDSTREAVMAMFGSLEVNIQPPPVLKPDIVFFGEGLPDTFHQSMEDDKQASDLLIVIGSSLKVQPVAFIPTAVPPSVPQILINREPLRHMTFDVELLGDCDVIVNTLCHMLGEDWEELCQEEPLTEITQLPKDSREKQAKELTVTETSTTELSLKSIAEVPLKSEGSSSRKTEVITEEINEVGFEEEDEDTYINVADLLPNGRYLYESPGRYVFPGAEYYKSPYSERDIKVESIGSSAATTGDEKGPEIEQKS